MLLTRLISSGRAILRDFLDDDSISLAAAVAFYTALSFGPLVLLAVTLAGVLGDRSAGELVRLLGQEVGPQAASVAETVIETSQKREADFGWWRSSFSIVMLLVTASGVFGQLQMSLNRIWNVVAVPGVGVWGWLRRRLLSMGMVIVICFLLLVSLVLAALLDRLVPGEEELIAKTAVAVISFVVTTGLFAALFKFVPDVRLGWQDVWMGAIVTAVLFTCGKAIVAQYLAKGGVGAEYGRAAGGLIALLVWVYYSSIIVFVGAEVTQHLARRRGRRIEPKPGAVSAGAKSRRSAAPITLAS